MKRSRCPVCLKYDYPDFDAAASAALRRSWHAAKPLRPYRCGESGGWHLTSRCVPADPQVRGGNPDRTVLGEVPTVPPDPTQGAGGGEGASVVAPDAVPGDRSGDR